MARTPAGILSVIEVTPSAVVDTKLRRVIGLGVGVAVGVIVTVSGVVGVTVGAAVGVTISVGPIVGVGVSAFVGVGVDAEVAVIVGVDVALGDGVGPLPRTKTMLAPALFAAIATVAVLLPDAPLAPRIASVNRTSKEGAASSLNHCLAIPTGCDQLTGPGESTLLGPWAVNEVMKHSN